MSIDALKAQYIDLSMDPIAIGYIPPGQTTSSFVYVNAAFTREFGYTQDQIAGKKPAVLHDPETWAAFSKQIPDLFAPGYDTFSAEGRLVRADGTKFWALISFMMVGDNDKDGRHICATYRTIEDIKAKELTAAKLLSERNRAFAEQDRMYAALEAAQARLVDALDAYPDPFAIYDRDRRLVSCNTAYKQSMSNMAEAIQPGMSVTDIRRQALLSDKLEVPFATIEENLAWLASEEQGDKPGIDLTFKNGRHYKTWQIATETGDIVLIRADTTELVRERKEAAESRDRLLSALSAYPDPFAIFSASGTLEVWNVAYANAVAHDPSAVTFGMTPKDIFKLGVRSGKLVVPPGREDIWIAKQADRLQALEPFSDFEFKGGVHRRYLRSKAPNGDLVEIGFDTTEVMRQRRVADDAHARLLAALNAYTDPIVIYDKDLRLVCWNAAYLASVAEHPGDLFPGLHLRDVLRMSVAQGKIADAVGREEEWIASVIQGLERPVEDVALTGDVHHRSLRSRAANGDYVVIRLNITEFVRQKRAAEDAEARLLGALNAYPSPFAIYDASGGLIVWNEAYRKFVTNDPTFLRPGLPVSDIERHALASGRVVQVRDKDGASLDPDRHLKGVDQSARDLELPGDIHHRLLQSRADNGDLVTVRIDTTELVRQKRVLETSQARLMSAINAYPDPFAIYDLHHNLVVWNDAYATSMTDKPERLRPGINLRSLLLGAAYSGRIPGVEGKEEEWVDTVYSPDILNPGVQDFEFAGDQHYRMVRLRTENGEHVVLRLNITEVIRQRREMEDYAKRLETANAEITHKARHDELTGLGNRRHLTVMFDEMVAQREVTGGELAALHIDLDRFKQINDTMGHAAGDLVLVDTSKRICARVEEGDVVARIGGDEFVILLHVAEDSQRPEELAERLVADLSIPSIFEGKECRFGASIGLARTPLADVDQLLINSDVALYKAKNKGRNQVGVFDFADLEELRRNKTLADDILRGIEQGEFVPFYQPQVDARTREVVGLEALARWRHPKDGILTPEAFLAVATDLNVAADIDRMIFETAIQECQDAFGSVADPPDLSFNVSAKRVIDEEIDRIAGQVGRYAGKISFELLETIFLEEEGEEFLFQLDRLRDLGISLEVDDFGSGRASVVALQRIGPDRVKIDRRLVAPAAETTSGHRLLKSIVDIGLALEMGVTAEGVETPEQAKILERLGCDRLQGYLIARPLAYSGLLDFMGRKRKLRAG